jgi:protein transport protein HofC
VEDAVGVETSLEAERPAARFPQELPPRRGGFRLRHLLYTVLYAALVCWIGVMTGVLFFVGFLGLLFAIVAGLALIYARRRSTQQDALLWALAIAAERAMPLAPTLEAFAGQCRGRYRRKVLAAAHDLRRGYSLPEVLDRDPDLFPRSAAVLIRIGDESGVLAGALRESSSLRADERGPWVALAIRLAYLLWVLILLQVVMGFLFYFVVPKLEAIFADFGVPLPAITVLTLGAMHTVAAFWPVVLLLLLVQVGLLLLVSATGLGVYPWDLPLVGRAFLRHHTALVLRGLSRAVEGGRSLDQALATLARIYPEETIRIRLRRVRRDVQGGEDWCVALLRAGLIRPAEVALLESAQRAGNLAWVLRVAAEDSQRRFGYRLQWMAQAILPLIVVVIGALVFLVVVSYFSPIVLLIQRLT